MQNSIGEKMRTVFQSDTGDLVRRSDCKVVREKYSYTFSRIENSLQLRATLRNPKYTYGGYPLFLIFGDGEPCCFDCARKEFKRIARDMREGYDASFRIVACDINYECNDLFCAHCNTKIESAYRGGDDDENL
jgi:hypothetical protein